MTDTGNTEALPEPLDTATKGPTQFPARWYIITAEETNEILMNLAVIERTVQSPAREHVRAVTEIIERVERRMA